jgi:hypothetical protein
LDHRIEPGMTEHQITFAIGAGATVRSSPSGTERVVDYRMAEKAGLTPVRVTFHEGKATEIIELESTGKER